MLVASVAGHPQVALYAITGDSTTHFTCTTKVFNGPGGASSCTGPITDQDAEWPALVIDKAPIVGAGVQRSLLGSVVRPGLGRQVTYAGHPLYIFDPTPGSTIGEGWDEPTLPPDHGVWWLMSPAGTYLAWSGTLTAQPLAGGATQLEADMLTGIGFKEFPVYSFSSDTATTSACGAACARLFPPLLTSGLPGTAGSGVDGTIGTITRSDGTLQVTYDGHPLYLYGAEDITSVPGKGYLATGSGNDKAVGSGTFALVTP